MGAITSAMMGRRRGVRGRIVESPSESMIGGCYVSNFLIAKPGRSEVEGKRELFGKIGLQS